MGHSAVERHLDQSSLALQEATSRLEWHQIRPVRQSRCPSKSHILSLSFCTAHRLLLQHPLLSFFFIRETSTLIFHLFYFMLIKLFIALNYRYSFCYHTLCNAKTHVHIITTMISTELIVVQLPLRLEMSDYWETI